MNIDFRFKDLGFTEMATCSRSGFQLLFDDSCLANQHLLQLTLHLFPEIFVEAFPQEVVFALLVLPGLR